MIGKNVVETKPIPAAKVKAILEDFAEENELNYEQNITLNHVSRFKQFSLEDTEKILEELEKIIKPKYAVRIVDLIPVDLADLRLIFAKEKIPIKKEEMEEILKVLDKYDTLE
ncbi:RNA polymerase Rpb4 family protein [Methanobrevibacter sp. OttesenSCG-928-K11]|nr:RNA polymerase Rpb4 family protein [Methanobrevibacter sp. OttesenSCG-928-K11]MDL2270415.1 RNA polymerase Rpb4 family protein [Methanobrevibacter sp. OttesenSCG-928-I08]